MLQILVEVKSLKVHEWWNKHTEYNHRCLIELAGCALFYSYHFERNRLNCDNPITQSNTQRFDLFFLVFSIEFDGFRLDFLFYYFCVV